MKKWRLCVEEKMKNEEMRRIERKETKKREKRVWERESRWGIADMTWQDKPVSPMSGMKLPYCHYNSVSITWKHLKYFFSFHNSSLKNKRIEWWKQKLETHSNTLLSHETHQFWVTGDGNRVMGDGNWKSKIASTQSKFDQWMVFWSFFILIYKIYYFDIQ